MGSVGGPNVLVVGGRGFLGSHVVDVLLARNVASGITGPSTRVLDNLSSCWLREEGDEAGQAPRFVGGVDFDPREKWAPEVLLVAACPWPLAADTGTYLAAVEGFALGTLRLVHLLTAARSLRRVVVASSLSVISNRPRNRDAFSGVCGALRAALWRFHRPPLLSVEFVHLPDLLGPRQLPEISPIHMVARGEVGFDGFDWENPFGHVADVGDAATLLVDRALETRVEPGLDFTAFGTPLAPDTLRAEVLRQMGLPQMEMNGRTGVWVQGREIHDPAMGMNLGVGFDLREVVAYTIEFYRGVGALPPEGSP